MDGYRKFHVICCDGFGGWNAFSGRAVPQFRRFISWTDLFNWYKLFDGLRIWTCINSGAKAQQYFEYKFTSAFQTQLVIVCHYYFYKTLCVSEN